MKFKLLSSRDEGDFQNLLADIRFLAGSRVRSKIIFALMDGERSISDIRRSIDGSRFNHNPFLNGIRIKKSWLRGVRIPAD